MSTLNKIKKLERERSIRVKGLADTRVMLRATFGITYRRCGKPNCWCARKEKGHPYARVTWSENGRSRTKSVNKENIDWVKKAAQNYRKFRKSRHDITELNKKFRVLVGQFEDEITGKTKKKYQ